MESLNNVDLRDISVPTELPSVAGWKEIEVKESGEQIVALGMFSDYDQIFTDSIYFGERIDSPYKSSPPEGSLLTMFTRESSAEQLVRAERSLPSGTHLVVFDSYRTLQVQASLYKTYYDSLKVLHEDWDEDQLNTETQKYVSLPSHDISKPSPHNTGGAVDVALFGLEKDEEAQYQALTAAIKESSSWQNVYSLQMEKDALIRRCGKVLNFGTSFDHGGIEASLNYYEKQKELRNLNPDELEARNNRRLLYNTMKNAGFQPYEDEWWHYNSAKSQMGAKSAGISYAEFGPILLSEQDDAHEKMRLNHRRGVISIADGAFLASKVSVLAEAFQIVRNASIRDGDPKEIIFPEAAIIKPSL